MPLPDDLLDAIAQLLDQEQSEPDSERRAELLAIVRGTLERWQRGDVSKDDALKALQGVHPTLPKLGDRARILAAVKQLPPELLQAVDELLEPKETEPPASAHPDVARRMSVALECWLHGTATAEQAVAWLRTLPARRDTAHR